jgi:hypothetical protein
MITVTVEYLEPNVDGIPVWTTSTQEVDVDADMSLSDETLDKDMCALPRKIAFYAELAAECHAYASRKKNEVEVVESEVAQALRAEAATNKLKITEAGIREHIAKQDMVTEARHGSYKAQAQYTMVDGFYRALREKASLAIALCYKQKEEIRVLNSPLE